MGLLITALPEVRIGARPINWESKAPFYYLAAVLAAPAVLAADRPLALAPGDLPAGHPRGRGHGGVDQHRPTAGRVLLAGSSLLGLKPHAVARRGVARTFQIIKPFPRLSVQENVTLAAFLHRPARREAEAEARRALDRVGLGDKHAGPAADLTLAEQKRLEMARALATRPSLLLLDELMGGLNPREVEEASELVRRIREAGVTVVLVEHVMKTTMRLSHRVVVIHHGEKIADGPPDRVVQDPGVIAAYLGRWVA